MSSLRSYTILWAKLCPSVVLIWDDRYHIGMSYNATAQNVTLFINGVAISRAWSMQTSLTPKALAPFTQPYIGRCINAPATHLTDHPTSGADGESHSAIQRSELLDGNPGWVC